MRDRAPVGTSSHQKQHGKGSRRQSTQISRIWSVGSSSDMRTKQLNSVKESSGLYRAEQRGFELLEYAEDCPTELATRAVNIWQRRRRHCALPRPVVEKFTPGWDWLIR